MANKKKTELVCVYYPHWHKDDALFFSIFNAPYFCAHRDRDAVRIRAELDEERQIVRGAGLGDIHFNAQGAAPDDVGFMAECGFDSLTDYNIAPDGTGRIYYEIVRKQGK